MPAFVFLTLCYFCLSYSLRFSQRLCMFHSRSKSSRLTGYFFPRWGSAFGTFNPTLVQDLILFNPNQGDFLSCMYAEGCLCLYLFFIVWPSEEGDVQSRDPVTIVNTPFFDSVSPSDFSTPFPVNKQNNMVPPM